MDPRDNLDLRIQGEPVHGGLTPYYADIDKVETYFRQIYSDSPHAYRRENILRNAEEWYLRFDDAHDAPLTIIKCASREIPDGMIIEGNTVRDDPSVSRRVTCSHDFAIPELGIRVSTSYARVFIRDWHRIEHRVRDLLRPIDAP